MLQAGYPQTSGSFWEAGFARLRAVPPMAGDVPLGCLLELRGQPVGVALLLPSRRPGEPARPRINAGSWVILPQARGQAPWAARMAMGDATAIYTALTPNPSAARMLERQGFRPVSHQCLLGFTARLAWRPVPAGRLLFGQAALNALRDDPLAAALEDHHRLGCTVTALATGQDLVPLVWRSHRRLRMLPTAELLYAPSTAQVLQHIGLLARGLLRRGYPMLAIEASEHVVPDFPCTRLFQRRFARGGYGRHGIDHLYSELVYLHR